MSKRGASTLELLLLALIEEEQTTPYSLLSRMGISPGASIPALARMEEQGLVKKSEAGVRGRQCYSITPEGTRWMEDKINRCMREQIERPELDPESLARSIALAYSDLPKRDYGAKIAEAALKRCREKLRETRKPLLSLERRGTHGTTEEIYRWIRLSIEAAQLEAEARVLGRIYTELVRAGAP